MWRRAAEANKEVIETCTANGFKLSKYSELWGPNNWSNNEMIFVRRYNGNISTLEEYNFPMGVPGGNSGNCPTQNMVDAYEMKATGKCGMKQEVVMTLLIHMSDVIHASI